MSTKRPKAGKAPRPGMTPAKPAARRAGRKASGDRLRVRMYNVLFGDAIIVTITEGDESRHILIDVGNVTGKGGDVDVFEPVIEDVIRELGGKPLDLYVMTHEHMDHVKGLLYANDQLGLDLKGLLQVRQAWLTASAAPDYYDTHEKARKKRLEAIASMKDVTRFLIARYLAAAPGARVHGAAVDDMIGLIAADPEAVPPRLAALLINNDYQSTTKCVEFLRGLAGPGDTHFVHREVRLLKPPDLLSARVEIWGPEEDTSVYYGRLRPLTLGLATDGPASVVPALPRLAPPSGVDAGAFFDLVEARRRGPGENLLQIDKAANNTSIVFCLEWNGWRLLFPGDAEEKSWELMEGKGLLDRPVDFLKVGHHGSHNGTPSTDILDMLLPKDGKARYAAVCTCKEVYGETDATAVPNEETLAELGERCRVFSVESLPKGGFVDLTFPADRNGAVVVNPLSAAVTAARKAARRRTRTR